MPAKLETTWKRSKKGNLYRRIGDRLLTVFPYPGGRFGFSIVRIVDDPEEDDEPQPYYCPQSFPTEERARLEAEGALEYLEDE